MKLLLVALAALIVLGSAALNPGVKIQFNQNGVDYAKSIGMLELNKRITGLNIPDVSGSESVLQYKLSQIKITSFNAPNSHASATLHAPHNVQLSVNSVTAGVSAHYDIKVGSGWFSVSKSGSVTASVSGTSLEQSLGVTASNGKPSLAAGACSANLGDVHVTFHGDIVDSIINLFSDTIAKYLKGKIAGIICEQLHNVIASDANKELSGIPISISLGAGFNIDYRLTGNPFVESHDVVIPMLGRFWYNGHQNDAGIPSAHQFGSVAGTEMICVAADPNAVIGSAAYAAIFGEGLSVTINANELAKFHMPASILKCSCADAQCVGGLLPQIQSKCNGTGTVGMTLKPSAVPDLTVNKTGAFGSLKAHLTVVGQNPGHPDVPLFGADVSVSAVIPSNLTFNGWKITFNVHVTGATLSLTSSNVGGIDSAGLQQLWQLALLTIVEGELNTLAAAGIQLPAIPYVQIQNPTVQFGTGILTACGSIKYNGPTLYYYEA